MEVPPPLLILCLTTLLGKLLFPCMQSQCPFLHLVTFSVTLPLLCGSDEAVDDCSYLTRRSLLGREDPCFLLFLCVMCSSSITIVEVPSLGMMSFVEISWILGGPNYTKCWGCELLVPKREKPLLLCGWWLPSSTMDSLIYHCVAALCITCDPRKSETVFPLVTWLLNRVVAL